MPGPSNKRRQLRWPFEGSGFAFASSVLLHASLLSGGAWLLARSLRGPGPLPAPRLIVVPLEVEVEVALPEVAAAGPDSDAPTALPAPLEVTRGGRHAPRPDLQKAGRGGERTSAETATNLASSIDPIALERDPETMRDRSQVSRLRTAWHRESRDDRRATPAPMELTFLATGKGHVRARRDYSPTDPARGVISGGVASTIGTRVGGQGASTTAEGAEPDTRLAGSVAGSDEARLGQGAPDGRDAQEFHAAAQVLFARPLVPAARAAVPTETRGRPNDTLDSSQEVAARVSSLLHASSAGGEVGPGLGGERGGGAPGALGNSGVGSRSSPSGSGFGKDFADDPGFSGYSRALRSQLGQLLAKAFPDWAIAEGRGGHVIFEMTLRADGKPTGVRIVRPSGVGEYDDNVLRLVRGVTSFGRLPDGFATPAQFRVSWDAVNPVVGREGGGPGGGHR
ncbi:MAG TPA: TonB family protein [Polyangiaceae bacterium]|nr:TonB family protein [Polyangiaceae bacterium]